MFLSPTTRTASLLLLFSLFLFPAAGNKAEQAAVANATSLEPSIKIDGRADDKAWKTIPFRILKSGTKEIKFKIHSDDTCIYLLVVFPSETENRRHMLWHWDPLKQYYSVGNEREDELYVLWTEQPPASAKSDDRPEKADVWIWRAARTDPAGYADDYFMIGRNLANDTASDEPFVISPDQGLSSWSSRYFVSFTGDSVPRFYQRLPEGSIADVKAKGTWESGLWTVEFCRKIDTGHSDDMSLSDKSRALLSIFTGPPLKSGLAYSFFSAKPDSEDAK